MNTKSRMLAATALTGILAASPAMAESKDYDLGAFNEISAATNISVTVKPGDKQSVTAKARSGNDINELEVVVEGDKLSLSTKTHSGLLEFIMEGGVVGSLFRGDNERFDVEIIVPELKSISASASAEIEISDMVGESLEVRSSSGGEVVLNDIAFNAVELRASSGGEIEADGTCTRLELRSSSGGDIDAFDLPCREAEARASSGGDIKMTVSDTVELRASSGGDIRIAGDAKISEQRTSSGGSVRRAN